MVTWNHGEITNSRNFNYISKQNIRMKIRVKKNKMVTTIRIRKKIKNPTKFLTSQIKLDIDAVKLVRKVREEFV